MDGEKYDLRLIEGFEELNEIYKEFNLEDDSAYNSMDPSTLSLIPFPILLMKELSKWRKSQDTSKKEGSEPSYPKDTASKTAIRASLESLLPKATSSDENIREALTNLRALFVSEKEMLEQSLTILDDIRNDSQETPDKSTKQQTQPTLFEVFLTGLKEFVDKNGRPPLS